MARSRFTGLERATMPTLPRLPELTPPDGGFSGGLGLRSFSTPTTTPIARAATQRAAAPPAQPSNGIEGVLRGSPVSDAGGSLAGLSYAGTEGPPPADPGLPPTPFTPPPTPTTQPTDSPLPLQGLNPYDPAKLNYEGQTYGGPSVQYQGYGLQPEDFVALEDLARRVGFQLPQNWRQSLSRDPQQMASQIEALFSGVAPQFKSGLTNEAVQKVLPAQLKAILEKIRGRQYGTQTDPGAASKYVDQAAFNTGLQRLRQVGLSGAREDEEALITDLAGRGLLNSGIASRELGRLRTERTRNYQQAANQLNAILFSNASSHAKQEAMVRLQAELELANQSSLAKLRAALEKELIESQHENDFAGFLGQFGGGIAGALTGGRSFYGGGGGGTQANDAYYA